MMPISPKKYMNDGAIAQKVETVHYVPVDKKVYNILVGNFFGSVDGLGKLQEPVITDSVVFSGVKTIQVFESGNPYGSAGRKLAVRGVVFPDLTLISGDISAMFYSNPYIESMSFQELTSLGGAISSLCEDCPKLASVNFNKLVEIIGVADYAFQNDTLLTSVSFPELVRITGVCSNMFKNSGITTVAMPKLKIIDRERACQYMYQNCGCTSIEFPELEEIKGKYACGSMFYNNDLTSISFPKLKKVWAYAMHDICGKNINLVSVNLSALETIMGVGAFLYAFERCSSLRELSFNSLKSVDGNTSFQYMLNGCSDVVVHFPSNLQSVIGSWSDVVSGFGGTNTTVLFDLPATE